MHESGDEARALRLFEDIADKLKLALAKKTSVFAPAARLFGIGAMVIHIIEHQEKRLAIFEGVIIGAKHALIRLAAVAGARRFEVQIMVAADIPPRKADLANDPVVAPIERKIIEHDVPRGDPEGSLDASRDRPRHRRE